MLKEYCFLRRDETTQDSPSLLLTNIVRVFNPEDK